MEEFKTCAVCGKKFAVVYHGKGRKPLYCSDACRRKANGISNTNYMRKRYAEDPEFRERRKKDAANFNRRRTEAVRNVMIEELTTKIEEAKNREEIIELLKKHVRIFTENL